MNNIIFYFFYSFAHQSVWIDNIIIFFASYFQYIVVASAIIFLYMRCEKKQPRGTSFSGLLRYKEIFLVFFYSGLAWTISQILKILMHTSRPFIILPDVQALFFESDFAFPSSHATFFMALATALFFVNKKVGYLFILFAFIIGKARIVSGVHFPFDILGGFALGTLVVYLLQKLKFKLVLGKL